jgi:hypothetical protein
MGYLYLTIGGVRRRYNYVYRLDIEETSVQAWFTFGILVYSNVEKVEVHPE